MFRIRMVTFDVTGTLLQFRCPIYEIYAQAGQRFDINADPSVLKKSFREEYARMTSEHPIFGRNTGLGWSQWWINVVKGTFKEYSKTKEDESKISQTADYLLRYFQTPDAWITSPGTHQLLQFLKRSYFKVGVLSNFDTRLHAILKAQDLQQYFDFILTSYEVGYEKPDAKIFEEALKQGRNISGSEAIHIGDDVRTDYKAAKSAGWNAMLVVPFGNHVEKSEHSPSPRKEDRPWNENVSWSKMSVSNSILRIICYESAYVSSDLQMLTILVWQTSLENINECNPFGIWERMLIRLRRNHVKISLAKKMRYYRFGVTWNAPRSLRNCRLTCQV